VGRSYGRDGRATARFWQYAVKGSGGLAVRGAAVGTTARRAPAILPDGSAAPLGVACRLRTCTFTHGGFAAYDGDGASFDMRLDATEGAAYAVALTLPDRAGVRGNRPPGAAAQLTFYYPDATGGGAAFPPFLGGPLGDWQATPAGHTSFPEFFGCAAADRACWNKGFGAAPSFELHPAGGSFGRRIAATWAAPAAGPVLLRIALQCEVPFFSDVEAEGCRIFRDGDDDYGYSYGCPPQRNGHDNGSCETELLLSVTEGAYFEPAAAEGAAQAAEMFPPVAGPVRRTAAVEVCRAQLYPNSVKLSD
jgi:hypothetical protein